MTRIIIAALVGLVFSGCAKPVLIYEILPQQVPDTNAPLDERVLHRLKAICLTSNLGKGEQVSERREQCDCMNKYFSGWTNLQFKKYVYEIAPKVAYKEALDDEEQKQHDEVEQKKKVCYSTSKTWSDPDG
jgi:hypothetical protein